jgi:DNA-binding transcriptional regulator YhcF (GntR family)
MNFQTILEELDRLYEAQEEQDTVIVEESAEDADDEVLIIEDDDDAEAPEAPEAVVLKCENCGALVIKNNDEVVVDEKSDLANVDEECAFCGETAGYTVIGEFLAYGDTEEHTNDAETPQVEESLTTEPLTEGKLLDNVKKVATRVGADAATVVRCFTELSEVIGNIGNKGEYKTNKATEFMEYVENKAVLKALMNGNESVMNGTTKEELDELVQDIEDYKKAKAGETEEADEEE